MTDIPGGALPQAVNANGLAVTTDTVSRGTEQIELALPENGRKALPQSISDTNLVVGSVGYTRGNEVTRPAVWQC